MLPVPQHILITGAGGTIGQHIVHAACRAKDNKHTGPVVVGLGHAHPHAVSWPENFEFMVGDILPANLSKISFTPDLIIHAAGSGSVRQSFDRPQEDYQKNVETTEAILRFAADHWPSARLVFLSSAAVYGNAGSGPLAESTPLAPISPYGKNKLAMEKLIAQYSMTHHLKTAIVRLFSVYGPCFRKQLLWDAAQKAKSGQNPIQFMGTGQETRDWMHVQDAVRLMFLAALHASVPPFIVNGGTGISTTNRNLVDGLLHALKSSAQAQFTGQSAAGDPPHFLADMTQARQIGFKPSIHLADGLAEFAAWYKETT